MAKTQISVGPMAYKVYKLVEETGDTGFKSSDLFHEDRVIPEKRSQFPRMFGKGTLSFYLSTLKKNGVVVSTFIV